MSDDYDFGKNLAESIQLAEPKERITVLTMIFKNYVAKVLEMLMVSRGLENGIEYDMLEETKKNLIREFRNASLNEYQRSEKIYEDLFDKTIQEVLSHAASAHEGVDTMKFANQVLDINPEAYVNEGGLYIPEHLKS